MGAINYRHLRLLNESKGYAETYQTIAEALQTKQLRPEDFSIRNLAEALIPDGKSWVNHLSSRRGGFRNLAEATNAVSTASFAGITGQIVFNKILEGYEHPDLIWPELIESVQTQFLLGERLPNIGEVGDQFSDTIEEGQSYPNLGLNEEFVDTQPLQKRGGIVPVTREIIIADRTGELMDRAGSGGKGLGVRLERRVLDIATGQTNTYKRNTVSTNTYLTTGAYINSQSNTLVDHTDLANAEVLLSAITDPNTGLPISQDPNTIIVPLELKKTAWKALNATEVATVDNQANAGTIRQFSPVPGTLFDKRYSTVKVLSNYYVKERTSSSTTWFYGNPKKSFIRMYAWDMETVTAGQSSEMAFTNDIMMRIKVSVMDSVNVKNPRYMSKNT